MAHAEVPRDAPGRAKALGRGRPPSPADFVGSTTVRQIIDELAASHEIVILDTPLLLPVSDSLTISEYADAALLVCGLQTSRRLPMLRNVHKLLAAFPTRVLGLVVTGVPEQQGYGPYYVSPQDVSPSIGARG